MGAIKKKKRRKHIGGKALFVLFLLAVAGAGIYSGAQLFIRFTHPLTYEEYISVYARENTLDKYFVMAVVKAESNFDPEAHSGVATGLMQLTDETAQDLCKKMKVPYSEIDLRDPKDNIRLGCYYLRQLIDKYGDIDVALAAYNGGPGNVSGWLKDPECSSDGKTLSYIPYRETREYVQRVNKYWNSYKELYSSQ